MTKILVIHGPNLNLLGTREPEYYGAKTLGDIIGRLRKHAESSGIQILDFQSNAEHELVGKIQDAPSKGIDFIIIKA